MEANQDIRWRRYWIYQGRPDRFDVKTRLQKGKVEPWVLTRLKDFNKPDDIVFYWSAGDNAGIYGWGEIIEAETAQKKTSEKSESNGSTGRLIKVRCRGIFDQPILKAHLSSNLSEFRALTILRNAQGTNFRVTALEAEAIIELINNSSQSVPPSPERIENEFYPAAAVADYLYSGTPTRLLNAGLSAMADGRASASTFDTRLFMSLLLDLAKKTSVSRPDATAFVRENLKKFSPPYPVEAVWSDIPKKSLAIDGYSKLPTSRNLLEILTAARIAGVRTIKQERIRLRHLIAGILLNSPSELELRLPLRELQNAFFKFVVKRFPDDNEEAWQQILLEEPKSEIPPIELHDILAKVTSDSPEGEDKLGITREVNAMAAVLAAKNVTPPFAIGLFGDWGSGKTFFLKKIKYQVEKIVETSKDAASTTPNAFCKTIVQIWFNAWHYVESNLWASLVDNIFRGLNSAVKKEDKGEEKYEALMKRLKLVQKGADLIREELDTAIRNRNTAREKRKELLKQKKSIKKMSEETLKLKVLDEITDETSQTDLIGAAKQVEDLFGIKDFEQAVKQVGTTARSLLDFISKAGLFANRTQMLWRSLIAGKIEGKWIWAVLIIIVLLVAGVVLIIMSGATTWSFITTSVTEAAAMLGAGIAWAKSQLSKASKVVDTIEGIQHRINQQVKEAEVQRQQQLEMFNNEIKQLDDEIIAGEKALQDLEEEVRRIEADMNATAPERLVQFIIERAESEDYRKQLGLMAMIREDFENLSDLMEKQKDA